MCGPTSPNWRIRGSRGPQRDENRILAIAGVEPQWENRAIAFALISGAAGPYFWAIHSAVRNFLNSTPGGASRLPWTLGSSRASLDQDARVRDRRVHEAYRPDGADMLLYARVR